MASAAFWAPGGLALQPSPAAPASPPLAPAALAAAAAAATSTGAAAAGTPEAGGGGFTVDSGGGGGSYLNPALRDTMETPDFNGVSGTSASNGYVIVGLKVFNYTGTVVEYTIPATGLYFVAAVGAQGGSFGGTGGYGAGVGGSVFLDTGAELDIVVGGAGVYNINTASVGGGGGGSFVWDPTAIPPQPVPEPSTWAMLLVGFVGLGYAGYRSTRRSRRDDFAPASRASEAINRTIC
jgi:PEP-CTERM motif